MGRTVEGESLRDRYADLIHRCAQCGTCTAACPTAEVSEFHVRRIVRRLQLDLELDDLFLAEIPWLCTQCSRCRVQCTEGLDLPDLIMALRRLALSRSCAPESTERLGDTVRHRGSPYRSLTRTKSSWIDGKVRMTPDAEILCWVGCSASIMSPNIARATAQVMDAVGGGFRMLEDEPCCGEPLFALGMMEEATEAAQKVVETVRSARTSGVKRIVTSCAGCYSTFTRVYPEKLGIDLGGIEILHLSQLLVDREGGGLELAPPMTVTYHDPCSLGRECGVYDAPRRLLQSIGGLRLEEMDPTRERAMCCGGGGGLWPLNRRMAMEIASRKLEWSNRNSDVEAVVTSCPMCYSTFRHTLRSTKSSLRAYELSEIVAMAIR